MFQALYGNMSFADLESVRVIAFEDLGRNLWNADTEYILRFIDELDALIEERSNDALLAEHAFFG